jgi:Zinc carboxypeptidase
MRKSELKVVRLFLISICIITCFKSFPLKASDMIVTAEATNYKTTSTYKDVMTLLFAAQKQSPYIHVLTLTKSTEGRMIPLVVISKEGIKSQKELAASGKPAVLIIANIHAGEIEGKEATQMLIREFAQKKKKTLAYLQNQVVLIIPIFNTDGNDKFGDNRGDNGPELAGLRANGQMLDLNRDFLKLETPEVKGLIQLYNQWDPVILVDMHTTNGSYHREPVTYTTQVNPNGSWALSEYMWQKMFPAVDKILEQSYGYHSIPYGNFVDRKEPEKGWRNHAFDARYGTNYTGLRNRFTILDENYAHADFKTRVLASFGFIKAILEYTNDHIAEMLKLTRDADKDTFNNYFKSEFALEFKTEKLFDFVIKSYTFNIEKIKPEDKHKYPSWYGEYLVKKTGTHKDYPVTYFSKAIPTRKISLPEAYVIPPFNDAIIANLKHHGIVVEKIRRSVKYPVEEFNITEIKTAKRLYQGHVGITLKGRYEAKEVLIQEGSYLVSMKQPLARLIPVLLEPESKDSLAVWGYMNRKLVRQWSGKANPYIILRIPKLTVPIERFQD